MSYKNTLAYHLSTTIQAIRNCEKSGNIEWLNRHKLRLQYMSDNYLPSGAGWDAGTKVLADSCRNTVLIFHGSYHHMDDNGMYDGWTDHTVTVFSTFTGMDVRISGPNRNDIKDYLSDTFLEALTQEIDMAEIAENVG